MTNPTSTPPASPLASPHPWNLVAADYTAEVVPIFVQYARDALRLAALPPGAEILDVAAGPGTLAFEAAGAARR
jgi:2-polyprenyl-3-methyl-5-hydroxy-6-metoxy-1,4-benzoquinol methylase